MKQLDANHTRMVYAGPDSGPTALAVHYTVLAGDLRDKGKRAEMESPNFNATASSLWVAGMNAVKAIEKIR